MMQRFQIDDTTRKEYNISIIQDYNNVSFSEHGISDYLLINNVKYSKIDDSGIEWGIVDLRGYLPSVLQIHQQLNDLYLHCINEYKMTAEDAINSAGLALINGNITQFEFEGKPNTNTIFFGNEGERVFTLSFSECSYGMFTFCDISQLKLFIYLDSSYENYYVFKLKSLREYYQLGEFITYIGAAYKQVVEEIATQIGIANNSADYSRYDISLASSDSCDDNDLLINESNPIDELNSLIGLDNIKQDVTDLISLVKIQQMRFNKGLKSVPVSLHLVFTGNPGTGKTTVARILAKLYKEIGVLKTGQLVEVDRADLVAGYVGQTAIKTQEKIKEAMGGVLFIDEAYTLAKDGNDFGQEAIDTLLKAMEDNRENFIVVVAGYDEPMHNFINSNPGLKSRFNKYFHFSDYSTEELIQIFKNLIIKYDYCITDEALNMVETVISEMVKTKSANFANAREIRNYFEKIITRQAKRVSLSNNEDEDFTIITIDDIKLV